jgi:hypothetical protein
MLINLGMTGEQKSTQTTMAIFGLAQDALNQIPLYPTTTRQTGTVTPALALARVTGLARTNRLRELLHRRVQDHNEGNCSLEDCRLHGFEGREREMSEQVSIPRNGARRSRTTPPLRR